MITFDPYHVKRHARYILEYRQERRGEPPVGVCQVCPCGSGNHTKADLLLAFSQGLDLGGEGSRPGPHVDVSN